MLSLTVAYDEALRGGVVVERLPALRLVRLTGPQRLWFLQNTITADVDDVPSGRWVESCFLDPKGRVQAHFRVGVLDDEVWIDVDPPATADLVEWFTRYRFRTKVEVEALERRCFTILGAPALSSAKDGEVADRGDTIVFGGTLGPLAATDVHGETPLGDIALAPRELLDVLRTEAGIGAFGVDYGPGTLPQEAGLTSIVPVDKGCYVGQETIARIHFRGHINKVLRPLTFEGGEPDALIGRELKADGQTVGRVTSAVRSPIKGVVGIGMVRVEPPEDTVLEVEGGGAAALGPIPEGTKTAQKR